MVLTCVIIPGYVSRFQRYPNIPWANTSLDGAIAMNSIRLHWIGIMFGCSRIISVAILSLPEQIVAAQLRVIGLEADSLVTRPRNLDTCEHIPVWCTSTPLIVRFAGITTIVTRIIIIILGTVS